MLFHINVIITGLKLFFIPLYHSTDFEVHRNWLALTHNLSYDQWYHEKTSEWTLDYPPFFAWVELLLSKIAKFFDPDMLIIENLNYDSPMTILFHRLSVMVLDLMYMYGVKSCSDLVSNGNNIVYIILVANPGLLMVDHIHFQYNGFLYGFLLCSMAHMIKSNFILAAIWFAVLLNLKHIFLYVAPAYFVYLLRAYCFTVSSNDGYHTAWYSFSILNLLKLGITVITVFALSFGPFVDQLPQLFSRLFPFKRGLCHAYWAPNFWALYSFIDKILQHIFLTLGLPIKVSSASMTGGLVQEFEHAVLPTITPKITFIMTGLSMVPALIKLWHLGADRQYRNMSFVRCLTLCATCSFLFSWHVHEKAILMIIVPLSFLSVLGLVDVRSYLFLSTVAHYSLFPLLYSKKLLTIKLFMWLTHVTVSFSILLTIYGIRRYKSYRKRFYIHLPMLTSTESLYLGGLFFIFLYENVFHSLLGIDKVFPFLPLMITSVYCSLGVIYFWISYYHYFLTFTLSGVPDDKTSSSASQLENKVKEK